MKRASKETEEEHKGVVAGMESSPGLPEHNKAPTHCLLLYRSLSPILRPPTTLYRRDFEHRSFHCFFHRNWDNTVCRFIGNFHPRRAASPVPAGSFKGAELGESEFAFSAAENRRTTRGARG